MRSQVYRAGALALALAGAFVVGCVAVKSDSQDDRRESKQENTSDEGSARKVVLKCDHCCGDETQPVAADSGKEEKAAEWQWGAIKGTIVYAEGEKLPENKEANITADKAFCTKSGKIHQDEWVVDEKSRGVKWVLVWLTDASDPKGGKTAWDAKQIHPNLKEAPKTLELDQPICTFLPRMTGVRSETEVTFKNSAEVAHNVDVKGGDAGPNINQVIPVGKSLKLGKISARPLPVTYSCSIHPWMRGYIGAFDHPYFAVTNEKGEFEIKDAPAGKFRLMVWQEGYGFVQKGNAKKGNLERGVVVTVEEKKTTELKPIEIKKED